MKLKIRLFKLTLTFVFSMIVIGGLIFSIFFKDFITFPWGPLPYIVTIVWFLGAVIFYIISIKMNYYILHKKYVIVRKYNKELIYNFSEIIYIDERQSEKHKMICFVTNKLHTRYLTFDKEGLLYKTMLEKCSNRLDEETFKNKYPEIKL